MYLNGLNARNEFLGLNMKHLYPKISHLILASHFENPGLLHLCSQPQFQAQLKVQKTETAVKLVLLGSLASIYHKGELSCTTTQRRQTKILGGQEVLKSEDRIQRSFQTTHQHPTPSTSPHPDKFKVLSRSPPTTQLSAWHHGTEQQKARRFQHRRFTGRI